MSVNPYFDILTGIKAALESIPLIPPVDIRYEVTDLDAKIDSLPLIVVAPSVERQQVAGGSFRARVLYDYPVDIVWVQLGGRIIKTGLEAYLAMEWAIQSKLFRPELAGVSEVFDMNGELALSAKFAGNPYRVRAWQFKYRTTEARG